MDFNIGVAESLSGTITRIVIMLTTAKALTILGIGVVTFKALDLFLETNIVIAKKKITPRKLRTLLICFVLIGITAVPLFVIIRRLIVGDFRFGHLMTMIAVGAIGSFVFSMILRRSLDKDDPRRKNVFLVLEAVNIAVEIIAENIANWIQGFIIGIINLILNVVRAPFISYYLLMGTIINLLLSFAITKFIGSSQMSGEVNIIGSLVGGLAHAIVRRKKIKELQLEIAKDKAEQEEPKHQEPPKEESPQPNTTQESKPSSTIDILNNL